MSFEHFPYTNFHNLNLDWVIEALRALETSVQDFVSINAIKYANPIQWNITSQYEKNTVVLDASGNAYLSVQAVPSGVSIDRTDFWTVIGNFSALWENVRDSISTVNEGHSQTASAARAVNTLVWVDDTLLETTKDLTAGDKYVVGGNCRKYTMQMLLDEILLGFANAQSAIDNEQAARQSADSALQTAIDNEQAARQSADSALQTTIDTMKTNSGFINVKYYGAIGDGIKHPLSEFYDNLGAAQAVFPFVTSLTISIDYAAIQKAVNDGACVYIPMGTYIIDKIIDLADTNTPSRVISGSSCRTTYLKGVESVAHIFNFTRPDVEGEFYCKISKMGFIGETANTTNAVRWCGIMSTITENRRLDANDLVMEDIYARNINYVVLTQLSNHCHYNNIYADTCNTVFYLLRGASFQYFNQCYSVLTGSMITGYDATPDGISNGILMTNCVAIFCNDGIAYNIDGWQAVYLCECTADLSHRAGAQIQLRNCTDFDINGGWISGINVAGSYGVILYHTFFGNIRGFTIANVDTGVHIDNEAVTPCSISIYGNRFAIMAVNAINIPGVKGLSIFNNTFDKTNANTIQFAGSSDYNNVSNNFFGNAEFDCAAGTHSVVVGNIYGIPTT